MVEVGVDATTDVVSFLCHAGQKYKEHRELLRRQRAADERRECTFRPTVTQLAEALSRTSARRRGVAVEARLHELHARRLHEGEARRAESQERAAAAEIKEMRPPRVTPHARALATRDPAEVTQRWLQQREAKITQLREEAIRRELEEVRPTPHITAYAQEPAITARRNGQRIEDYFMAKEEARRERMYWLAEQSAVVNTSFSDTSFSHRSGSIGGGIRGNGVLEFQEQQQQGFTPRITEYAKRLHRSGNVVDRLHNDGNNSARVLQDESCTFIPRVSPASAEMYKNYYRDPNAPVYDRLYRNELAKSREIRQKKRNEDLEKEITGIPRISETSRLIVERKRTEEHTKALLQESSITKLYFTKDEVNKNIPGKTKNLIPNDKKENQLDEDYTFQPRVNSQSDRMWKRQLQLLQEDGYAKSAAEARELLWRRSQKRMEEEIRRRREQKAVKEMSECTFHPKVGRSPERQVERELSVLERNERWRQQRERRLQHAQKEIRQSELSECSFHPAVDSVFPLPTDDAGSSIPGYEAHIHRQAESRRRKQETEEWWRPKQVNLENKNIKYNISNSITRKQNQEHRGISRSLSSRRSQDNFSSDPESTEFVVYQAPTRVNSVSPRSSSSKIQYHHYVQPEFNNIDTFKQSTKPSPVDFIINHHRAILESSRRS